MTQFRDNPTDAQEHTAHYRNWDGIPDEAVDDDNDDPDPYVDLIQRDPVVCDTCFLFRYDVISCDWWRGTFGWSKFEHWKAVPGRSEEIPGGTASQGVRLVCKNCGTKNEKRRPIPSHLIDEYADNLSSTLRSKGIDHNPDVLRNQVQILNTSDNQGKQDTHVFAPAVRRSIQYSGRSRASTDDAPTATTSD